MSGPPHRQLAVAMAVAALLGLLAGWFVGPPMVHVDWIGEFFLRCLNMLIVPLVTCSMIVGIGLVGDVRSLGRMGRWTVGYYLTTTAIAALVGLLLVVSLQPGSGVETAGSEVPATVVEKEPLGLSDFILGFLWPNVIDAMAETKLLPVILFSLVFGALASTLGEAGKKLLGHIHTINEVMMRMVGLVMWIAPLGVFALLASRLGEAGGAAGMIELLTSLGAFALTVIVGLTFHSCVVLPALLRFLAGRSPLQYLQGMLEALLSAFSTSSSAATLPITLQCVKDNNKVREQAADFVLPLGATVNMDGTALYEAVAAVFIAQVWGIALDPFTLVMICVTATVASIGAAGIPSAGLVTMVIVLQATGLPLEGIGLILSIDWFLDRCRTVVNVWGDAIGAAVVARHLDLGSG